MFSIGHSNRTTTKVLHSKLWCTVNTGKLSANQRLYVTLTGDQKEKRKSPRFAILTISVFPHLAHLQSHTSQPAIHALQKSQITRVLQIECGGYPEVTNGKKGWCERE